MEEFVTSEEALGLPQNNYRNMTRLELEARCRQCGLAKSGNNKAILVQRLEEYDNRNKPDNEASNAS